MQRLERSKSDPAYSLHIPCIRPAFERCCVNANIFESWRVTIIIVRLKDRHGVMIVSSDIFGWMDCLFATVCSSFFKLNRTFAWDILQS